MSWCGSPIPGPVHRNGEGRNAKGAGECQGPGYERDVGYGACGKSLPGAPPQERAATCLRTSPGLEAGDRNEGDECRRKGLERPDRRDAQHRELRDASPRHPGWPPRPTGGGQDHAHRQPEPEWAVLGREAPDRIKQVVDQHDDRDRKRRHRERSPRARKPKDAIRGREEERE